MKTYKLTDLTAEAYNEALRQTASLWNSSHGYKYNTNENCYELETWADDAELEFDEDGNML